eukprot:scaffold181271_cov21-Tisochrysis_lutea.AAC.1
MPAPSALAFPDSEYGVYISLIELCWKDGKGRALGERAGGGTHQDGCGRRRKDLCQLAPAASCCPHFGTELRGAITILSKLQWEQSVVWLKISTLRRLLTHILPFSELANISACRLSARPPIEPI